eukprot:GEMP01059922.1.p1 GENE.GEMP01059922.1~~GEMP01059922.1.p1  ORF type:complete len:103 (-),score=3.43 GEMP01059922.1:151-459(-)
MLGTSRCFSLPPSSPKPNSTLSYALYRTVVLFCSHLIIDSWKTKRVRSAPPSFFSTGKKYGSVRGFAGSSARFGVCTRSGQHFGYSGFATTKRKTKKKDYLG